MKYLRYLLRNAFRNKLRSILTMLAIAMCLMLTTALHGVLASMAMWSKESAKYNRVVVMNVQGFAGAVPYSVLENVRKIPGVVDSTPFQWFGGLYRDEKFSFAQFGTEPDHVFNVWSEFKIPKEQLEAFKHNRQGCVVDRSLAEKYKWQLGEHIRLKGTFYDYDLDLELVGIYDPPEDRKSLYFNWHYLNEALRAKGFPRVDNCGTIFFRAESQSIIPSLSQTIDERFVSSDTPTATQTESAFAQRFVKMQGNIQNFVLFISVFVTIALVFVAANSMAMSMRERVTEIAVLKAIGFGRGIVLTLLLGEAVTIACLGGLLGVFLGRGVYAMLHEMAPQLVQISHMAWSVVFVGMAVAGGIGLASGVFPAVFAVRLPVADGLRRVV